ncbi:MAG: DUF3108 domain-containing protein [Desulfobacteraceae bacterium]|nr:DUF3108 domain-containing protein [Desulfobacteraceae bacterium]MBU4002243.1 DUF3108 domain-containing protein [Pseudomonadota bacterium]MBU4052886.1 DUF3108 domain-containing protein [Pseudomonadota bacterium]
MKTSKKSFSLPAMAGTVILFLMVLSGGMLWPGRLMADDPGLPFQVGEKLIFELRWSFIPAGTAVLEVMPMEKINGEEAYHFVMTASTNSFVDKFYKVRDRIDAYADLSMTRSLYYRKQQREGRSKKDIVVQFDWKANQVSYSNSGKKKDPVSIAPGTFDPFSVFYFSRTFDWSRNSSMEQPVTDGKKLIMGKANLKAKEKIKVPVGEFETYLFEPGIENIGGVFEKKKGAKIEVWVTADHRKIPVRLKSEVSVGSFIAELVSIEGADK